MPPTCIVVLCLKGNVVLGGAFDTSVLEPSHRVGQSFACQRALLEMHRSQTSGPR